MSGQSEEINMERIWRDMARAASAVQNGRKCRTLQRRAGLPPRSCRNKKFF